MTRLERQGMLKKPEELADNSPIISLLIRLWAMIYMSVDDDNEYGDDDNDNGNDNDCE